MTTRIHKQIASFFPNVSINVKSGFTVALVSIPLSISLAVAAGATPTQGIVTAIWAGLIAGLLGGSHYNIVGPTGALSGLLATFAFLHGVASLPLLAFLVGIIIVIAGLLRLERYLLFIPANTVQGFTLGVAFIIGFNQLNFALGLSGLPRHEAFIENVMESFRHIGMASPTAAILFVVFLCALFAVDHLLKRFPRLPRIPAAALLAPVGIALGALSVAGLIPLTIQTLGSRYADISPTLFLPFSWDINVSKPLVLTALTVALVAILETMLSAKIADGMTKTKHQKRKEILGLGFANIASGLAGGIPATAALARTALNIKSGATHKSAAVFNAIFVTIISLLLLTYFAYIPLPVVAAILVMVAIRMIERKQFSHMWHIDRKSFVLALGVALITIITDPMLGILAGAAVSLLLFLDTLSRGQFDLVINDINKKIVGHLSGHKIKQLTESSDTLVYSIKGHLTYIDSQAHISRFEQDLNGYEHVILRLRELYFVDIDGVDAFDEIIELIEKRGKTVFISGANDLTIHLLRQSHSFKRLEADGRVFPHTADALNALGFHLNVGHEYR